MKRPDGGPLELGRGAMGITYKAFDTSLQCPVALKVISGAYLQSEVARQRFMREARAAAALRHPNVASVYHLGCDEDMYFYAMEFIDGETVEQFMKREGAVPPRLALEIGLQVSRALGAAHNQGLVHRDIKPANLMLVRDEAGDLLVKVIDFGLAKSAEGHPDDPTITMGGFLGTPHFASPEQLEEKSLDIRSDIYSLGVTLWYMLSGKTPFSGSLAQVMSQHLNAPAPLAAIAWLPGPVVALLGRMMAKRPEDRPQNPHELRREIEQCLQSLGDDVPAGGAAPAPVPSETAGTFAFDAAGLSTQAHQGEFETAVHEAPMPASTVADFSPGGIVGGRYKVAGEGIQTDRGLLYPAEVIAGGGGVGLLVLAAEQIATSESVTAMEDLVGRLAGVASPAIRKVYSLETVAHRSFLVVEDVRGGTLLDLLRSRRVLPLVEALPILSPIASAVDELASRGVECPELLPHDILLAGDPPVPKFLPFAASPAAAFDPGATVVSTTMGSLRALGAFGADPNQAAIYAIASLAYEILGGVRSASGTVVPIAGLSEDGNSAVRRALDPRAKAFESAVAFLDEVGADAPAYAPAAGTPARQAPPAPAQSPIRPAPVHPEPPPAPLHPAPVFPSPAPATPPPQPPIHSSPAAAPPPQPPAVPFAPPPPVAVPPPLSSAVSQPPPSAAPSHPPAVPNYPADEPPDGPPPLPEPKGARGLLFGAVAVLVVVVVALGVGGSMVVSKLVKSGPADPGPVATPTPAPSSAATPAPTVDPVIEILSAIRDAGSPEAAIPLVAGGLAKFPSEPELGKAAAEVIATLVESKPTPSSLAPLIDPIVAIAPHAEAGHLTLLAKWIEGNPKTSPPRIKQAQRDLLRIASDKGSPEATFLLGESYFHVIPKDPQLAVELYRKAADSGDPRALNKLGDLYLKGLAEGGIRENPEEAFGFFTRAAALGFGDAQGNLGVMYLRGFGTTPPSPERALEVFAEGARKGYASCLFFYGACLEEGIGLVKDPKTAALYYAAAARGGYKRAADWCKENGIDPASQPPPPGLP